MKGILAGRSVLFVLVLIHFVLPFTPVNTHSESRIVIGSLVLGGVFFVLAYISLREPRTAFLVGVVVLACVYILSAVTGASPASEGFIVKCLLLGALIWGLVSAHRVMAVE